MENASNIVHAAQTPAADLLPPQDLQDYVGEGFYREVGAKFLEYFKSLCGLRPHEAVLDVGCGSGRLAIPLTRYLNGEARYEGFDLSHAAIKWCQENISMHFPQFRFQVSDVRNDVYAPGEKRRLKASKYTFPYANDSFDFVFLTSVFTHLVRADMKRYVSEVARVLKPGGRCLATFFLLNAESRELMPQKALHGLNFKHRRRGYQTLHHQPEHGIAFDEGLVRKIYRRRCLKIREPISYGAWCGRETHLTTQDVVIAVKDSTNGLHFSL
ncbi:MAG: class I SAM-dependent methyltransferase [Pyrinomonadaceae bacterium]